MKHKCAIKCPQGKDICCYTCEAQEDCLDDCGGYEMETFMDCRSIHLEKEEDE